MSKSSPSSSSSQSYSAGFSPSQGSVLDSRFVNRSIVFLEHVRPLLVAVKGSFNATAYRDILYNCVVNFQKTHICASSQTFGYLVYSFNSVLLFTRSKNWIQPIIICSLNIYHVSSAFLFRLFTYKWLMEKLNEMNFGLFPERFMRNTKPRISDTLRSNSSSLDRCNPSLVRSKERGFCLVVFSTCNGDIGFLTSKVLACLASCLLMSCFFYSNQHWRLLFRMFLQYKTHLQ